MSAPTNSEVTKKLRAAIRAKLEELGVYVDDELPDYIMVMVANKKEKRQMKDDLNLFLSKNTDAFVEWLFDIFERLQSASKAGGVESASAPPPAIGPVKPEKKKEPVKRKADDSPPPKKREPERKKETAKSTERKRIEGPSKGEADRERERERDREKERRERERRDAERRREQEDRDRREKEDRDRREREKESKREAERRDAERRDREEQRKREREREAMRGRERAAAQTRHQRHDTESEEEEEEEPVPIKKKVVISQLGRAASPPPVAVSSKIVVKRPVKPRTDQNNKGMAGMFMKAMNAASASAGYGAAAVTVAPNKGVRKRPASALKHGNAEYQKIEFSDEEEFANGDEENEGDIDEEEEEVPPKTHAKKTIKKEMKSEAPDSPPEIRSSASTMPRRVIKAPSSAEKKPAAEPRFIITLGGNGANGGRNTRAVKRAAKKGPTSSEESEDAIRVSSPRKTTPTEKRRRIEDRITRVRVERVDNGITVSPPQKHSSPTDWDGQINFNDEESSDEEARIDAIVASTRPPREARVHAGEHIPPTAHLSRGNSYYDMYDPSAAALNPYGGQQYAAPQAYVPTPLSQNNLRGGVVAFGGQSAMQQQQQQQQMAMDSAPPPNKLNERCRFWPACKLDNCIYVHPTKKCMTFPKCKFGNSCLYVHPACKFGAVCTNHACTYVHYQKPTAGTAPVFAAPAAPVAAVAAKSEPVIQVKMEAPPTTPTDQPPAKKIEPDVPLSTSPPGLSAMIPCRFKGACTNPVCHFKHPKECRFGQGCFGLGNGCYFYHPPGKVATVAPAAAAPTPAPVAAPKPKPALASPSKFKWSAKPTAVKT